MNKKIRSFIDDWKEVRGKTYKFLKTVPEDKINWSPHKDLGTFGMQIRHIGVSQRAYVNGIKSGKIDFDDKSYDKKVETDKAKGIYFLKRMDKELFEVLDAIKEGKKIKFHDGVYGVIKTDVKTVLEWLMQHEAYHQGIFTCYGRLAGLGKFRLM